MYKLTGTRLLALVKMAPCSGFVTEGFGPAMNARCWAADQHKVVSPLLQERWAITKENKFTNKQQWNSASSPMNSTGGWKKEIKNGRKTKEKKKKKLLEWVPSGSRGKPNKCFHVPLHIKHLATNAFFFTWFPLTGYFCFCTVSVVLTPRPFRSRPKRRAYVAKLDS